MTFTSSSDASVSVSFTPSNVTEVNEIIDELAAHMQINDDLTVAQRRLKKLRKIANIAFASAITLQATNEDLLAVAKRQQEKTSRFKGHLADVRVMNLQIVDERNKIAQRKIDDKLSKQVNRQHDQDMKQ